MKPFLIPYCKTRNRHFPWWGMRTGYSWKLTFTFACIRNLKKRERSTSNKNNWMIDFFIDWSGLNHPDDDPDKWKNGGGSKIKLSQLY